MRIILIIIIISLLISAAFLPLFYVRSNTETNAFNQDLFFGVTYGGNTTRNAKLLIDKVKGYTNLFIVDSWAITGAPNETALDEICQYAIDAKMYIIVYFDMVFYNYTDLSSSRYNSSYWDLYGVTPWHTPWLNCAKEKWGNQFLGIYLYDEPGGKQIDTGFWYVYNPPRNLTTYANVSGYSDAADRYVRSLLRSRSMQHVINSSVTGSLEPEMTVFTSDYALYWFDYQAGYDAVFAEVGGTEGSINKIKQISLCRGAAKVQDKQWGVIITWTYDHPPYLESGREMLQDLVMAYGAGAKYVVIFNYPLDSPYGSLTEDHFTAMENFWNLIHRFPRNMFGNGEGQVAFVLPEDYGWGMRHLDDKIWGLWPADNLSSLIWDKTTVLIQRYGSKLDMIYGDPAFDFQEKYTKVFFWNNSI